MARKKPAPTPPVEILDRGLTEEEMAESVEAASAPAPAPAAPVVVPRPLDPRRDVLVDFLANGQYERVPAPPNWFYDRRISLKGLNFEHVGEGENGVWLYRGMS